MTKRLTDDEMEFLQNSKPYADEVATRKSRRASSVGRRPSFPKIGLMVVVIVAALVLITITSIMSDLKPYSDLADSDAWTAISKMTTGDDGVKNSADQVSMANEIYSLQGPLVTGVIVLTVIIIAIVIGQWYLRLWAWEDRRKEHAKDNIITEDDHETPGHHRRHRRGRADHSVDSGDLHTKTVRRGRQGQNHDHDDQLRQDHAW